MTPTYDQLLKDIQAAGVNFSDYDLAFAKENPTAGYGILNAKKDYAAATTAEARALANAAAEQWRNLGGYNAGVEGSGYNPILPSSPQSMGNTLLDSKTSQLTSFPAYQNNLSTPTWDDKYGAKYDAALNGMIDYAPFSYDYKTDPLYASYKQAYTREGQRASADALGQAAAASGGIPSSFATTAAAQAGNYYAAQLADKIPDLYQLAYQQYADQYNRMNNNVGALQNARSFDYGTYQDALSQYNADRNFGYGVYSDEFNRLASQIGVLTDQDNTAYTRMQAALKAAGRGSGTPAAEEEDAAGLSDSDFGALRNTIRTIAQTDPAQAAAIFQSNFGKLSREQQRLIGSDVAGNLGMDLNTVWSGLTPELIGFYGDQYTAQEVSLPKGFADANTKAKAQMYLNENGYGTGSDILSEEEFNSWKNKTPLSSREFNSSSQMQRQYGTYDEYKAEINRYKQFPDYYYYLQAVISAKVNGAY